jgi:hypothetical protein
MKIEVAYCKDRYSTMVRTTIVDVKKFLVFEPAWLWLVKCITDDETAEVVWERREGNEYALLCTRICVGESESGIIAVAPAIIWKGDEPKVVEWDEISPMRSVVKDPFYITMYNRTDLIEFSDLVLSKLAPAILMAKVSRLESSVKQIMIEVLNNAVEEKRKKI